MANLIHSLGLFANASGSLPEGRVFALDGQTLIGVIIHIANMLVLFFILYKLLYNPVKEILAKRTDLIQGRLKELEIRERKARDLIAEYEAKLLGVENERLEILQAAKEEGREEKKRIITEAEKEAAKIKADVVKSLETEKKLLQRKTKDYVLELSALLAEKTLKDSVDPESLDAQFEESLKALEAASWRD